ncbi:MAG: hypothetical protein QM570_15590 [Planctomycetota bacterium]|jgi:hypothetical protein|nr:hypothetical protein [Planctomycetota bacterium]
MTKSRSFCVLLILLCSRPVYALEPNDILVLANVNNSASVRLVRYYCERRGVPNRHVVPLVLGATLRDSISRDDYDMQIYTTRKRLHTTNLGQAFMCSVAFCFNDPHAG